MRKEHADHHHAEHQQAHRAQTTAARDFPRQAGEGVVDRMVDWDRLFRYQITHPTQEKHPGEGNDKRRDFQSINQQAHKRTKRAAHHQHQRESQQRRDPPESNRFGEEHAGKGDHRPDGEIDPAGEDHEGHADGDNPQKGVISQNVANHTRRGETGELRQAVEIAQHKDAQGDHER
ncbi:hypothetical protein D3C87_1354180 [compost metagenome]